MKQLERFGQKLELHESDLRRTEPIPEVRTYLQTLHRLFIETDYLVALGAELAVETTAISDIAKTPFSATSARMMMMSTQGKGVGVCGGIVAMAVAPSITCILSISQQSHHQQFSSLVEQCASWVIREASIRMDAKDKG